MTGGGVGNSEATERLVKTKKLASLDQATDGIPSTGPPKFPAQHNPSRTKLIVCALGIFLCYFYYGIIQEKITRTKYGPEKEVFVYAQSLVFVQCIVNATFALILIYATNPGPDDTPSHTYAACAFSYLAAMVSSNHALQFIAYPAQVLGKSCKPIPIMVFGVLFARKRYPLAKYCCVTMIVAGVALFLFKDNKMKAATGTTGYFSFGWGEMLLLLSLTMDGTTGAIQDRMRAQYSFKSHHMMLNMNLWSTLFLLMGILATGEIFTFFHFLQRFPWLLLDMVSFSFSSAIGQFFIFMTVTEFGPLTCSIVTTTRKFFTILASVIYFQNPMTGKQWLGTIFVFLGLVLDSLFGKTKKPAIKH